MDVARRHARHPKPLCELGEVAVLLGVRPRFNLVDMVQNQTEDLSKALEVSVQQLTSKGQSDQQLLQDYVGRLSALGVTEISILSSERKVVAGWKVPAPTSIS